MKNALSNDYENLLLKHMIDMAHSVGVNMCIEGIETEEELHKVLEMGSDFIQGFYYSKPLPFNEITDYLKILRRSSRMIFFMGYNKRRKIKGEVYGTIS